MSPRGVKPDGTRLIDGAGESSSRSNKPATVPTLVDDRIVETIYRSNDDAFILDCPVPPKHARSSASTLLPGAPLKLEETRFEYDYSGDYRLAPGDQGDPLTRISRWGTTARTLMRELDARVRQDREPHEDDWAADPVESERRRGDHGLRLRVRAIPRAHVHRPVLPRERLGQARGRRRQHVRPSTACRRFSTTTRSDGRPG